MEALCSPVFYKDITTDDFPLLLTAGLDSNKNFEQTTRLHLLHKRHWPEPTYLDILTNGWTGLLWTRQYTEEVSSDDAVLEFQGLSQAGGRIRKLLESGVTIFPRLQTVAMGSVSDELYNAKEGSAFEKILDRIYTDHSRSLPLALLDLPTVQHYCQGVAHGPLALSKRLIKTKTPLKTYTRHTRGVDDMFCTCAVDVACNETCQQPPIVLGAINRYYCVNTRPYRHYFQIVADDSPLDIFWEPVLAMFTRPGIVFADRDTGRPLILLDDIPKSALEGTTVEIYSFVRTMDVDNLKGHPTIVARDQRMLQGIQPPQSLERHQRALDRGLPEVWKGKVRLFNREDAPPCAACGFDLEGEFQAYVDRLAAQEERESLWRDVD